MSNLKEMAEAMKLEALDDRAEAFFVTTSWKSCTPPPPCSTPTPPPGEGGA